MASDVRRAATNSTSTAAPKSPQCVLTGATFDSSFCFPHLEKVERRHYHLSHLGGCETLYPDFLPALITDTLHLMPLTTLRLCHPPVVLSPRNSAPRPHPTSTWSAAACLEAGLHVRMPQKIRTQEDILISVPQGGLSPKLQALFIEKRLHLILRTKTEYGPGRSETPATTGRLMPARWFCTPVLGPGHLGRFSKGNGMVMLR